MINANVSIPSRRADSDRYQSDQVACAPEACQLTYACENDL